MDGSVRSMYMDILERHAVGEDLYRVTIAANEEVRQPPRLDFSGLSTENYSKNPVVMWAHDVVGRSPSGGLPIGRTVSLTKTSQGRIVADFEFLDDDPFARRVKNAWDKGFLRAASISWVPVKSVPVDGTWRDTQSDLLEWSIVSVPADPEALRESHRRLMDALLGDTGDAKGDGRSHDEVQAPFGGEQGRTELAAADGRRLLSLNEYEDLETSLALLRDVVEGAAPAGTFGCGPSESHEAVDGGEDGDLEEVRRIVRSMKTVIASS